MTATLARPRCTLCGHPVDPAALAGGYSTHPACGPDEAPTAVVAAGPGPVLQAVADANPAGMDAALAVIHRLATTTARFTANDCRQAMDLAGVPKQARGPAFGTAARRGWMVRVGTTPSTDPGTHSKPVTEYQSQIRSST